MIGLLPAKPNTRGDNMPTEHWKPEPEEHDFPAATDYLSLLLPDAAVTAAVTALRAAPLCHRKAKDLLRASALPVLPPANTEVAKDLEKVKKGMLLSPVLLIRGSLDGGWPLTVADGYHRICASYVIDEDADIPCRITDHR
jgi:hypothetical protein